MNHDIQSIFDKAAHSYDQSRKRLVPCFDKLYGTALDVIPFEPNARINILDLGAGTGLLSALISETYPAARLTLIDISSEMLDKAKARFGLDNDKFEYRVADFATEEIGDAYDLVVSALALHHTPQDQLKDVFKKVYGTLNGSGWFINVDQTLGATPGIESRYDAAHQREIRAAGGSEAELATALNRMKADKTATLVNQLAWLQEAGFIGVDCWYKDHRFVVYSGIKPNI